jgi:tetratricopeptide (TPR) repeat protein
MVGKASDEEALRMKLDQYHQKIAENVNSSHKIKILEEIARSSEAYLNEGKLTLARQCYMHAVLLTEQKKSWPYIGLGLIDLMLDNFDEAEMAFILAAQCDDDRTAAYCGLARVYQLQGLLKDAAAVYDNALKDDPDNIMLLTGLFRLCRQSGEFTTIIDCLQNYLKGHTIDTTMMLCLASLYYKVDKSSAAMVLAERVLELEPDNKDAAIILSCIKKDNEYVQSAARDDSCGCAGD